MDIVKNRNYLLLLIGRVVTNIGDSLYYVTTMWLVYKLGGNAFYTGLAGFLTLLPASLQFITGPFVDQWQVKKTLIVTQLLQTLLIFLIPITYYFDLLTVQLVLIIMPIASFIQQFAYPSQTKALPIILEKKHLIKGNSYFAFAYQGIDLVFNAISGILVTFFGVVLLYLADSIIFAMAAILFSLIQLPRKVEQKDSRTGKQKILQYITDLKEGFRVVYRSLIAVFLIGSIVANFCIGAAMAILPSLADVRGGPMLYGFYLAAMSVGGLVGALCGSWMGRFRLGIFVTISFCFSALLWILAAIFPIKSIAIVCFALAWIPIGGTNVIFATTLQTVVPHELLGRINTVSGSMSAIAMPIGSIVGGYVASVTSSTLTFSFAGLGFLFVSIVWLLHSRLRRLPKLAMLTGDLMGIHINKPSLTAEGKDY